MALKSASTREQPRSDLKIVVPSRLTTFRSENNSSAPDQSLRNIADYHFRGLCFEAVYRVAGRLHGKNRLGLYSFLPQGNFSNTRGTIDLLDAQLQMLKEIRVHFQSETKFRYYLTGDTFFEGSLTTYDEQRGSLFQNKLFTLSLPAMGQISNTVIGGLIVAALTSIPSTHQSNEIIIKRKETELFSCTINAWISGPNEELMDDMILELVGNVNQAFQPPSVWRSRQLCLAAAGFNPGKIDGIYGRQTEAAERRYSEAHGSIAVNWNSKIFARHVISHAYKSKNSERLQYSPPVDKPKKSRGHR